jgi:hypothetical protein
VRFQAICVEVAGNQVREAPYANTGQQLERGSEISATWARGTCKALSRLHMSGVSI